MGSSTWLNKMISEPGSSYTTDAQYIVDKEIATSLHTWMCIFIHLLISSADKKNLQTQTKEEKKWNARTFTSFYHLQVLCKKAPASQEGNAYSSYPSFPPRMYFKSRLLKWVRVSYLYMIVKKFPRKKLDDSQTSHRATSPTPGLLTGLLTIALPFCKICLGKCLHLFKNSVAVSVLATSDPQRKF